MSLADFFKGRPKRRTQVTLAGCQSAHIESEDLKGLPTVSDHEARQMAKYGWPVDEKQTTADIYAACEAIREKRPRDPVGYVTGGMIEIAMSTLSDLNHRRWVKGNQQ